MVIPAINPPLNKIGADHFVTRVLIGHILLLHRFWPTAEIQLCPWVKGARRARIIGASDFDCAFFACRTTAFVACNLTQTHHIVVTAGSWEKGIEDYKKIEAQMMGGVNGTGSNGFSLFWDDTGKASFVWDPVSKTLVSFDTKRSVQAKGQFVRQQNLGGIFAWELDGDNGNILNAMHEGLGHPRQ